MPLQHSSSSPSTANHSPRARRPSRPLPFTLAIPPVPATFTLFDQAYSNTPSRPPSPSIVRSAIADMHSVLYGGAGRDRTLIADLVSDMYDVGAIFENPVTIARGQDQIADLFSLLGVVPGQMWSEMGDICESPAYVDGGRLITMSHTFHYRLLGAPANLGSTSHSNLHPSHSFHSFHSFHSYTSVPSTPFPQQTPVDAGGAPLGFLHTQLSTSEEQGRWPLSHVLRQLRPWNILDRLSTGQLKLYSRLVFNEQGKITHHEDVVGFKEMLEGLVPVLGHFYALNRQGLGFLASTASRFLLRRSRSDDEEAREGDGTGGRGGEGNHFRGNREFASPLAVRKSGVGGAGANVLRLEDLELRFGAGEDGAGQPQATLDTDDTEYNNE